ncbi:uncharacterized protein LOC119635791 [Glossina fuscipes]|uniref:Uncharacterized protein LOC119635791 n=1 Tax=Glossina fuscipes TaxID=7396 RepID=A0A8U0WM48_9MUSC|nr:uncharacterized protein LOC119635791 [Glossina fuscipes]
MTSIRMKNWLGRSFSEICKSCANFGDPELALGVPWYDSRVTKGLGIGAYQKKGGKDPKLTPSGEKFEDKATELVKECNIIGALGRGKVFNNIDQEYKSIAVIGFGREGARFNDLEMIDECLENLTIFTKDVSFKYMFI